MEATLPTIQTWNPPARNPPIINTQAQKHIQELQAKVAQYEQEKLRLKKKDKKIEQVKLCWQGHNQEAAQVIMPTISEIGLDVDARLDWEEKDAVADYLLAVYWKLFANSSLISEDKLGGTGKRLFTDLTSLEIVVNKAINQHLGGIEIDHDIVSHGYIA